MIVKFTLSFYLVFLILWGCISSNNEVVEKKNTNSQSSSEFMVNNRLIGFSYDPVPEKELPYRLPKGDNTDPKLNLDHGSMAEILGLSISSIRVNYFSAEWENLDSVIQFLIKVLEDPESRSYDVPVWSQPFFLSIMCTVHYNNGNYGRWLISKDLWTASIENQSGKVWFVTHTKFAKKIE